MIPRLIHMWWHDSDIPDWVQDSRDAWALSHPLFDVDLTTGGYESIHVPGDNIRHRSNIARWDKLLRYGGVWVDCDTTPVYPIDELLDDGRPFCGYVTRVEATVIGGPPGHRLFGRMLQKSVCPDPAAQTSSEASGSKVLSRVVSQFDDVRILEPGAFFDVGSNGVEIPEPRKTPRFTTHRWDTSRERVR